MCTFGCGVKSEHLERGTEPVTRWIPHDIMDTGKSAWTRMDTGRQSWTVATAAPLFHRDVDFRGDRYVPPSAGDCVANAHTSNHVRVRKFSKHLAATETYFFYKGSVFSTLSSSGLTEVKSISAVDAASGSIGLESDFSVGEGLSKR